MTTYTIPSRCSSELSHSARCLCVRLGRISSQILLFLIVALCSFQSRLGAAQSVQNDNFNARKALVGQTNLITFSNASATKELGEPNHAGSVGGASLWWSWTARADGSVSISTRDSLIDTTLAVYIGTSMNSLTLVGENDDEDPNDPGAGALVTFMGKAGQTYEIAVDGYRNEQGMMGKGTIVLSLLQIVPPKVGDNDLFVSRFPIVGSDKIVLGANNNAFRELKEPYHANNDGGRSVWWSWIAPASTAVTIDSLGSDFDTLIGVYIGDKVDNLTLVVSDVASAGDGKSVVTFKAVKGVEYQIAVDGFNNGQDAASGRVVLNLHQFPPGPLIANDNFKDATPIARSFPIQISYNIGTTREINEPTHLSTKQGHSVWWTWMAEYDEVLTISTRGSLFDTLLGVYTGNTVNSLSLVAENDDINPGVLQSSVTFTASKGTVYRIVVDGYENKIGKIILTVSRDTTVSSSPRIQQSPIDKTCFADGAGVGSNIVFSVVATGSLPMVYQWSHNGVNLDGATSSTLSLTNISALGQGTYRVTVSNSFGQDTSKDAVLTLVTAPFNDQFTKSIRITGTATVVRGSVFGATKEPNEPRHGGNGGGSSVWWKWTANVSGEVEINTFGSTFDTLLGIYTGDATDLLTLISQNDDVIIEYNYKSRVVFNAVAGQEYNIAVDGFKTNYSAANVMLTIAQPPGAAPVVSSLTGVVEYYSSPSVKVAGVKVALSSGQIVSTASTGATGAYVLNYLPEDNYSLTPIYTADSPIANGVTTADITLIRQHILGLELLNSPYKVLAGDVNRSGSVTTADITLIRRLILGTETNFTAGLWRFVPSNETFADATNPWTARWIRQYASLASGTLSGQDFKAIKLGDVNGSWNAPVVTSGSIAKRMAKAKGRLTVGKIRATAGETMSIPVSLEGVDTLSSLQLSVAWDSAVATFEGVEGLSLAGLSQSNLGLTRVNEGILSFSWDHPSGRGIDLKGISGLFQVKLRPKGTFAKRSEIRIAEGPTRLEVMDGAIEVVSSADPGWFELGAPREAGFDSVSLRVVGLNAEGNIQLEVRAPEGMKLAVEASDSLKSWTEIEKISGQGIGAPVRLQQSAVPENTVKFWRLKHQ